MNIRSLLPVIIVLGLFLTNCRENKLLRTETSLNGTWELAYTSSFDTVPDEFPSTTVVPGTVDLAVPGIGITTPGDSLPYFVRNKMSIPTYVDTNRLYESGVYWYKTRFATPRPTPDVVQLKINKSKYATHVYVNGKFVGKNLYCFTPGFFNVREFLNEPGQENELLIGVGTFNNLSDSVIYGFDYEKTAYLPGIYDNVTLICTGKPFIRNIQLAPQPGEEQLRVVVEIEKQDENHGIEIHYTVRELVSKKEIISNIVSGNDFVVSMKGCRLWSPESPFLYEITLSTGADSKTTRFGMRSFSFDPKERVALLNGKPYYLRGTNVCIFRFMEDKQRKYHPWENDWVTGLHQKFKSMHWNSIRYCIGFPPERWYEIADSLGFLIQDEYPVWTLIEDFPKVYPGVTPQTLANEYKAWMREHWNHPSVVIWDAQNETKTTVTHDATALVRHFDLSGRPWENGFSAPQAKTDPMEAHPYLLYDYQFDLRPSENGILYDLLDSLRMPYNDANKWSPPTDGTLHQNPYIINEYGWLWLNRDSSACTLTEAVYDHVFGENLSKAERVEYHNRTLAAFTEYWRAHRKAAGVLHFCALGYSRMEEPRGPTSDNFIDIDNLIFEPKFEEYVKPAFSPVGVMVNFWKKSVQPGETIDIEVYLINDLTEQWRGECKLTLLNANETIYSDTQNAAIESNGRNILKFKVQFSSKKGEYVLKAEIDYSGEKIESIRFINVK